jgi:hypothetical protein
MTNETLQKVYDAARALGNDIEKLPQLIEAIKEHRTAEVAEPTPEPATDPTEPAEPETTP